MKMLDERYWLRRRKQDVETSIGEKEETIVNVPLSITQRMEYRRLIAARVRGSRDETQSNIVLRLRKVCNHPLLINAPVEIDPSERDDNPDQQLINCAGKMLIVDKLLAKLRADGAKVLIFSQMTKVLDLLERFCAYRGYVFERIDGQVIGNRRQLAMDRFNNPALGVFVFLLCTRAGGQGLNLTAATNVIIYDSDWNPQNDIQAQARCHRIGQRQRVSVYRLITAHTYEADMFRRASQKLGLDQAISAASKVQDLNPAELENVMRRGWLLLDPADRAQVEEFRAESIAETLAKRSCPADAYGEENDEAALSDERFWQEHAPELQTGGPVLSVSGSRERRQNPRYADESNDSDNGEWTKPAVHAVTKALLKYGFGRWDQIADASRFAGSDRNLEDGCAALAALICGDRVSEVIGTAELTTAQQALMRKFGDNLPTSKARAERLLKLAALVKWQKANRSAPVLPPRKGWEPEWDAKLLTFIKRNGWGGWEEFARQLPADTRPPERAVERRITRLLECMQNSRTSSESTKHRDSKKRSDHKKRHDHTKHREHHPKEVALTAGEQTASAIANTLRFVGEPETDSEWSMFAQISGVADARSLVPRVLAAATSLYSQPGADSEELFKNEPDFMRAIPQKVARAIAINKVFFAEFRAWLATKYDQRLLGKLPRSPEWWDHARYDPPLFTHLLQYGFARPCVLVASDPFIERVPRDRRDEVIAKAEKSMQMGKRLKVHTQPELLFSKAALDRKSVV
jgi:superfamily II DNA/RNA helicase